MNERILFVDIEPNILNTYQQQLRKEFAVVTTEGDEQALKIMASEGPFAVVVSDIKNFETNSAQLIYIVKEQHPDAVRLILTSNTDQETAVSAVESGDVYRFLNKPCSAENMIGAINNALDHYRLLQAEQVLLENTVKGSIQAMVEVLSIVSPKIFGNASLIKSYVVKCAEAMDLANTWELEAAGLLCQIGAVTLPENMLDKALKGNPLSEEESSLYQKYPEIGAQLIDKIPRLEGISNIIRYQNKGFDGSGQPDDNITGDDIPLGARVLKPVMDLVAAETTGLVSCDAFARLAANSSLYDPNILKIVEKIAGGSGERVIKKLSVSQLKENMIIADDIISVSGTLLVKEGHAISPSMIERLINFCLNGLTPDRISVYEQVK